MERTLTNENESYCFIKTIVKMKNKFGILLVVAMTFFCSCNKIVMMKEISCHTHLTTERQLDYLVNMSGDISVLSKMLGEDSYYLESVRSGKGVASLELQGKIEEMMTYQCEHCGHGELCWMRTRRHYGDKRWYDFFIFLCDILLGI